MGLAIEVGILDWATKTGEEEAAEHYRAEFERINQVLADRGLPPHVEPVELPQLDNRCALLSYPYSFLHTVRRVFANRWSDPDWIATPVDEDEDPTDDPVVEDVMMEMTSHLLCHSDAEGFYLPLDFTDVIYGKTEDEITGGMLGSSYRLRDELAVAAPALGIRLIDGELPDAEAERINGLMESEGPLWIEQIVWLSLYEAARLSIQHRTAICFC